MRSASSAQAAAQTRSNLKRIMRAGAAAQTGTIHGSSNCVSGCSRRSALAYRRITNMEIIFLNGKGFKIRVTGPFIIALATLAAAMPMYEWGGSRRPCLHPHSIGLIRLGMLPQYSCGSGCRLYISAGLFLFRDRDWNGVGASTSGASASGYTQENYISRSTCAALTAAEARFSTPSLT